MYCGLKLTMSTYIVGFCLMDTAMIASGIAYNGSKEGIECHDRIRSVEVYKLETSTRVKDFLANWNISVHEWLKYYVYLR